MSNHHINLQTAVELTTRYRNNHPADFFICETYEASSIQDVLNTPGCVSLRIYLGRKPDNSVVTVLVGVNEKNEDILPLSIPDLTPETIVPAATTAIILEDGYRCPEACPPKSPLNP